MYDHSHRPFFVKSSSHSTSPVEIYTPAFPISSSTRSSISSMIEFRNSKMSLFLVLLLFFELVEVYSTARRPSRMGWVSRHQQEYEMEDDRGSSNYDGVTVLQRAVMKNHSDIVKLLLKLDTNVNVRTKDGSTPLHLAATFGEIDIVKSLLDSAKVNLTIRDNKGQTPLMCAQREHHSEVVKLLNDRLDVSTESLIEAVKEDNLDLAKSLVKWGADVNGKDDGGYPVISVAAANGHTDIVRYLVEDAGVPVDAKGDDGGTALKWAANSGYLPVVKYLVSKGALIDSKDYVGGTPLWIAAYQGRLNVVKYLVSMGADVNTDSFNGRTPLSAALGNGLSEVTQYLRAHGAKE